MASPKFLDYPSEISFESWHSEMNRKASFPFAFHSFFRNFAAVKRIVVFLFVLLTGLSAWCQQEVGQDSLFQATAWCDGKPVLMTFHLRPMVQNWAVVGIGRYDHPAINTLTAGRLIVPDTVPAPSGARIPVRSVARSAFAHCSRLTEVVLPSAIEEVGDQSFFNCSSLREVTLPSSLRVIWPFAFRGCENLDIVRLLCTKRPAVYDNIFDQQTLDRATLIVPAGTDADYANSLVFGMFRYRTEAFE